MQLFLEQSAPELISIGESHTNGEIVNGPTEIKVYILPLSSSCVLVGTVFGGTGLCSARTNGQHGARLSGGLTHAALCGTNREIWHKYTELSS